MKKTLQIKNDKTLKLEIEVHLNKMKLTIIKKTESLINVPQFRKRYEIDTETQIDKIIEDFYIEYLNLTDIEYFWTEQFKDAEVIEINLGEDEETVKN